jgi:transposase
MDALTPVVHRRPYNRYHAKSAEIEPVCRLLATLPETEYTIREVAKRTGIPENTIGNWRRRIRHDRDWRPRSTRFTENPRLFDDAIEARMATYLHDNFIATGRDLPPSTLRQTLLFLVQGFIAEGLLPESAFNFKCSYKFASRFLRRTGLSFRRGRPCRRPELDEDECFEFLVSFYVSVSTHPLSAIVNFDESSWRVVMISGRTVAPRGAETVRRYVNGDVKASFTFFASVLADGTKLPLILLAKGKTERCHKQLGTHPGHQHDIWHSPNGWSNAQLVTCYLDWLRAHINAPHIVLILDQFDAHDTLEIHARADELSIELVFIPRGGTGTYQPLDRRVFGALKSKGRAKWMRHAFQNPGAECTRPEAARLLLESWEELPEACVQSGWDLDQDPEADESSDDGEDEEWRIEMDQQPLSDETSSDSGPVEDVVQRYGAGVF